MSLNRRHARPQMFVRPPTSRGRTQRNGGSDSSTYGSSMSFTYQSAFHSRTAYEPACTGLSRSSGRLLRARYFNWNAGTCSL